MNATNDRIEKIARRAMQLTSMTSHGRACQMAGQEVAGPAEEMSAIASLVSQRLTELQTFGK
jgi:hypothetical protein